MWNILRNKFGYILVETLIAVVVMAFGLILVLNAISAEIHALRISRNYTHATLLLEEKLCEEIEKEGVVVLNQWLPDGMKEGRDSSEKFEWQIRVEDMSEGSFSDIAKVTATVKWKEIPVKTEGVPVERELTLITYASKLQPK